MNAPTAREVEGARGPIASLLHKCTRAQQKLAPGTWQHRMLGDNIQALRIASALMNDVTSDVRDVGRGELLQALAALASMIERTEKAQAGFAPGTSQHSLLRNRLNALQAAEALTRAELGRRDG